MKGLGQLRDVEPHAHAGHIRSALGQRTRFEHLAAAHARQKIERFRQRGKILEERTQAEPVLARERVVGKAVLLLGIENFLVQPVPARADNFEFEQEVERHALIERVFERRVQCDLEISFEKIAFLAGDERGIAHLDALGMRNCAACQRQRAQRKRAEPAKLSGAARKKTRHARYQAATGRPVSRPRYALR